MKICIVGPKCSGKTALTRALAGAAWEPGKTYTPTIGVRIQEIIKDKTTAVELWDCSGDDKYENCRPAMAKNAQGLILVYNLSLPKQQLQLEKWYQDFAVTNTLSNSVCKVVGVDVGAGSRPASGVEDKLEFLPHMVLSLQDPVLHTQLYKLLEGIL